MPPKKPSAGVRRLIGKSVWCQNKYDEDRLEGILVGVDDTFVEIESSGRVYFFNKDIFTAITEALPEETTVDPS